MRVSRRQLRVAGNRSLSRLVAWLHRDTRLPCSRNTGNNIITRQGEAENAGKTLWEGNEAQNCGGGNAEKENARKRPEQKSRSVVTCRRKMSTQNFVSTHDRHSLSLISGPESQSPFTVPWRVSVSVDCSTCTKTKPWTASRWTATARLTTTLPPSAGKYGWIIHVRRRRCNP